MSISQGTRLGSYVVQDFIGQGAMGVVYRAYHAELERVAAVKVLQGLSTDPDSSARFRREAQAIAHLRHPNVLNVFDFGEYQGTPYMIVEYVEGGSLSARLKRSPIDQDSALRYLQGIGEALDYAHSHGIVHRDVKPANVLLGTDDTPILADFGLVKLMQSSSIVSLTGMTTGTPAYMAPEQVSGQHVGPAADRYAFAVMAYEMLTGSFPFDEPGVLEVLYAHVHKEPPAPSTRNEALGPRVDAVMLRGLAKDPDARWESCDAFVIALTQALGLAPAVADRTVVMAPPLPGATPSVVAVAPAATAVIEGPREAAAVKTKPVPAVATTVFAPIAQPGEKDHRRRRIAFAIAAALLLLLLSTGGIFVFEANQATLDVSPAIAAYGQQVVVTAAHVPANQTGEIRLESVLHRYSFQAGGDGKVTQDLVVPYDIETGDHHLLICWNGQCPAQTTLKVVAGVAGTSPLPGQSPTSSPIPGSSPSSRPSSGSSPRPGSSPTSNPAPNPTPTPKPAPSPTSNPCPTPPSTATLSPSGQAVVGGATINYTGINFTPNTTVTLRFYRGAATSPARTWTVMANCNGGFTTSLVTPTGVVESDHVTASDAAGRHATATFSVLL